MNMHISAGEHKIIISEHFDQEIEVEQNAALVYIFFVSSSGKDKQDMVWKLNGRGASLQAFGFDVRNQGAEALRIRLEFLCQATVGTVRLASVLGHDAHSDVRTTLAIAANAHGANAYSAHHTLLVPSATHVPVSKTSPILEIATNDVKASHAATTSTIDEDALWYCAARGISKLSAQKILIEGFIEAAIARIPDAGARQECEKIIQQKLLRITGYSLPVTCLAEPRRTGYL